jgi:hypothetical protein
MRRGRRLLLPLILLGIGTYLLIGCIPIPGSHKPRGNQRPESYIGGATSSKPLRLGYSTLADVSGLLGQPRFVSVATGDAVYAYTVNTVTLIWPLCFYADPQYDARFLVVHFGSDGRLERYTVYKTLDKVRQTVPDLGPALPPVQRNMTVSPKPPATNDPNAPPRDAVPYRTVPGQ